MGEGYSRKTYACILSLTQTYIFMQIIYCITYTSNFNTQCANCLIFTHCFLQLPPTPLTVNNQSGSFPAQEWTSCLTGCGLRGSWAQETRWARAANPLALYGNLYMPTKYHTVCMCEMYTQAQECNKEISTD